jgi:hypothetical protein
MNDSKKPPAARVDPALTANELAKLKDLMAALDANGITKQWTMTNAGKPFDRDLELKYFARALNGALDSDKSDLERVRHFVENRTALHQYIIKQRQITKRFTLSLPAPWVFMDSGQRQLLERLVQTRSSQRAIYHGPRVR